MTTSRMTPDKAAATVHEAGSAAMHEAAPGAGTSLAFTVGGGIDHPLPRGVVLAVPVTASVTFLARWLESEDAKGPYRWIAPFEFKGSYREQANTISAAAIFYDGDWYDETGVHALVDPALADRTIELLRAIGCIAYRTPCGFRVIVVLRRREADLRRWRRASEAFALHVEEILGGAGLLAPREKPRGKVTGSGFATDWEAQLDTARLFYTPCAVVHERWQPRDAAPNHRSAPVVVLREEPFDIEEFLASEYDWLVLAPLCEDGAIAVTEHQAAVAGPEAAGTPASTALAEPGGGERTVEQLVDVLARAWPAKGQRHHATLAAAGVMARRGVPEEVAVKILFEAATRAGDEEADGRPTDVRTTYENLREGRPATGIPKLREILGDAAVTKILSLLPGGDDETVDARDPLEDVGPTPYGHSLVFARLHRDGVRYVTDRETWYLHDQATGLWAPDPGERILNLAQDVARQYAKDARRQRDLAKQRSLFDQARSLTSPAKLRDLLVFAASNPSLAATTDAFDADPYLLKVQNGAIELRTGTFRDARPEDLLTMGSPARFDPEARCPRFEQFLDEVFGGDGELIAYVRKIVGYALTADAREQLTFLCYGEGENGKSTFLGVLEDLLGPYAAVADMSTFLPRKNETTIREDLTRLAGKRLVTVSEAEKPVDEALLKKLTGGDTITARAPYLESIQFRPRMKLLFSTNRLPRISNQGHAIWRRIRVIPFSVKIPEAKRDKRLPEALRAELPGILNWALSGLSAWLRDGLPEPRAVLEATGRYRAESDTLAPFLAEYCEVGEGLEVSRGDLYDKYHWWADRNGERRPLTSREFKAEMDRRGFVAEDRSDRRYWIGIALRARGLGTSPFEGGGR